MQPVDFSSKIPISGTAPASGIKDSQTHRIGGQSVSSRAQKPRTDEWVIDDHHIEFAGRQSINDKFNMVARTIRIVDRTMTQIEENLQRMKRQLVEFRKLYPPFPPGSEERVEMIRQFNLLKRQIDALTFPPESADAAKIMADPDQWPEGGGLQLPIGENGDSLHIRPQPVHTGADGLDIPEMPALAEDPEIDATIKRLDRAQQTLTRRRNDLEMDVRQQIV